MTAKWPHRRLADLLHEWATATGPEKERLADAYAAMEKEMAELLAGLFRAYARHHGEHRTLELMLGETAYRGLQEWQDTLSKRYERLLKRCEQLERDVAALKARPQLKVHTGG